MADAVVWSESARLMWSSVDSTHRLDGDRAPRVVLVATESSVAIDLVTEAAISERHVDRERRRIAEIAIGEIDAIELEGGPTARSPFDWELLTGFAVERDPAVATTGLLIRSHSRNMWVLRLDGDFKSVVPRLAELFASKERRPLPA